MSDTPGPVDAMETHISQLFFTRDRVYKLLKPVETSFLSFSDRDTRLAATEAEYRLNRRISPDVYLGLASIDEDGTEADRVIVMRRLPADRQLHRMAGRPDFEDQVVRVARLVATFHAGEEAITDQRAAAASVDALRTNWADNLETLAPLAGSVLPANDVERVAELVDTYLRGRSVLFDERIADGHVRDGHGDLRAEHVFCLDDGPRLIDCLAFRDDYRIGDTLNDVAFLAMDLHRIAGPEASRAFVRAYDEFTAEVHPSTLAHHYVAYRAHVRAKIAAIRFGQGDREAAAEVAVYHRLALDHLEVGQVRLVLVGGGAGAGKSTVAEGLAARLGAIWLRSDEARQTIDPNQGADRSFDPPGEGRYRPERSNAVYDEILREAEELLTRGESVVLDATWLSSRHRDLARDLADRTAATLSELHCVLPLAVARERIARRMASMDEPSEATPDIATYLAERFEHWPEAHPVDTTRSIVAAIERATAAVAGRQPPSKPSVEAITIDTAVLLTQESIRFYLSPGSAFRGSNLAPRASSDRSGPVPP